MPLSMISVLRRTRKTRGYDIEHAWEVERYTWMTQVGEACREVGHILMCPTCQHVGFLPSPLPRLAHWSTHITHRCR